MPFCARLSALVIAAIGSKQMKFCGFGAQTTAAR
jgi:hypothetical protein